MSAIIKNRGILLRRFLLLASVMFWQGGFTFYTSVVVPVGTEILGSAADQGWITRSVTNYLNLAALPALVIWVWVLLAEPASRRSWRCLGWLLWGVMAATLACLVWLHGQMDALMEVQAQRIVDRVAFRSLHRPYLIISTVQWAAALLLLGVTIKVWRDRDRSNDEC